MDAADIIYWDTSAVLSALFHDVHSDDATTRARSSATHLLSSLGWTEAHAVISRIEREDAAREVLIEAARDVLESGLWRRVAIVPQWSVIRALSRKWPLRGADLWHLATAKRLHDELPELRFLSFDTRLAVAAAGEGLV